MDNLNEAPADIHVVQELIFNHFDIKDRWYLQRSVSITSHHLTAVSRFGLLTHCYDSFSKAHFAALTRGIAEKAAAGDALCVWLFSEAGRQLGRHIRALAPAISPALTSAPGGLNVVCVGSVWKSWSLLKQGFLQGIKDDAGKPVRQTQFSEGSVIASMIIKHSGSSGAHYGEAQCEHGHGGHISRGEGRQEDHSEDIQQKCGTILPFPM